MALRIFGPACSGGSCDGGCGDSCGGDCTSCHSDQPAWEEGDSSGAPEPIPLESDEPGSIEAGQESRFGRPARGDLSSCSECEQRSHVARVRHKLVHRHAKARPAVISRAATPTIAGLQPLPTQPVFRPRGAATQATHIETLSGDAS